MEKEFVPYELAVKLKKLGLKIKRPFGYYCEETYEIHDTEFTRMTLSGYKFGHIDKIMAAPLWQQAFDWFRNKSYGAFVETWVNSGVKKFRGRNNYPPLFITDVFCTYEEARLECLRKLIKIIEDEKNI